MVDVAFRRKWWIVIPLILALGAGIVYTVQEDLLYRASSLVMVDLTSQNNRGSGQEGSSDDVFARNDRTLFDELLVLRNSNHLAERVAERLMQDPTGADGKRLGILTGEEGRALSREEVSRRLPYFVSFIPLEGSKSLIQATAISAKPREAVRIVNAYAEAYAESSREAGQDGIMARRRYLEDQLETRRQELQAAEQRVNGYLREAGPMGLDQETTYLVSQIAQAEAQLSEAASELQSRRISLEMTESRIAALQPQLSRRIADGIDKRIEEVQARIVDLEGDQEAILAEYPRAESRSQVVQQRLGEIERAITQARAEAQRLADQYVQEGMETGGNDLAMIASLRNQALEDRTAIRALEERTRVMEQRVDGFRAELRNIPQQSLELAQLQRAQAYAEEMHRLVAERLVDARLTGDLLTSPGYVSVLRAADQAYPFGANTMRNLLVGLFVGLSLGIGLALLRERLDSRINTVEEIRERGYVDIGVIPDMKPLIKEDFNMRAFVDWQQREVSTALVGLVNTMSTAADAYRRVTTTMLSKLQQTEPNVIVVSSNGPNEGKTVTSSNLAIAMASAGRRTVLIDADLRRPRIRKTWGLPQGPGLRQLLNSEDARARVAMSPSGLERLFIITAGDEHSDDIPTNGHATDAPVLPDNPSDLIASKRMQDLVKFLKERFDVIIIDTPPTVACTDSMLLAPYADMVVLVARAGVTKTDELDFAVESIEEVTAAPVRVLLNGFSVSMAYGYKLRYQHYTKYGWYDKYSYNDEPVERARHARPSGQPVVKT